MCSRFADNIKSKDGNERDDTFTGGDESLVYKESLFALKMSSGRALDDSQQPVQTERGDYTPNAEPLKDDSYENVNAATSDLLHSTQETGQENVKI